MLPLLFPECQLSLGSFDCIDCNEFSVHTMMNIMILLLLLLLLQPLFFSFSAHFEREQIMIYFFFPLHLNNHLYSFRKQYSNNNSSSDKDDNPWLDECLLICV